MPDGCVWVENIKTIVPACCEIDFVGIGDYPSEWQERIS